MVFIQRVTVSDNRDGKKMYVMNSEIISVGTELLLGEIVNTDASFIAGGLSELGINVFYQTVVGDNANRLQDVLKLAFSRSDLIIATGGLGPTQDDITKEVISDFCGKRLVLDEDSLLKMKEYLKKKGREMPDCNIKQAMLPEGCIILPNSCGTAPGCIIEHDGKIVIMLPGPPHELKQMFLQSVKPYLESKTDSMIYSENLKIYGMGESRVCELLDKYISDYSNPTVAPYAEAPGVRVRITAKCRSECDGKAAVEKIKGEIKAILGDVVYSETGESLPEAVVHMLIDRKLKISSAESCTGGLFAKYITDVPGSSAVLNESYVTYANEAKTKILGVSTETLKKYGAVSEQTAYEMADGLFKVSGADICAVFTGIAGPDGGTDEKPVGLVYVGLCIRGKTEVFKLLLTGTREAVRKQACLEVFNIIRKKFL